MKTENTFLMKSNDITAVVLTKNEEVNISTCLESLSFCKKRIVIDDYSTDETVNRAKESGATVFRRHIDKHFAKQRNFALTKVKTPWVFFVDADEIVPEALKKEILTCIGTKDVSGYYVLRRDVFNKKILFHGEWGNARLLRLGRVKSGKWMNAVHEVWNIKGMTSNLSNPLYHYSHKTIESFLLSILTYSRIHSTQKRNKNTPIIHTFGFPFVKFVYNYFVRFGFLDGVEGLIYSSFMSLHSFLAWNKYYENK